MVNPENCNKKMLMQKSQKGFALLITLSALVVIIALVSILLGYFSKAQSNSEETKALLQANLYFTQAQEQLKRIKGKQIKQLYNYPILIDDKKSKTQIALKCSPIPSGININWLALDGKRRYNAQFQEAMGAYDFLVTKYNIQDPDALLESIVLASNPTRDAQAENTQRLKRVNSILSYGQFSQIVKRYELEYDDKNVRLIPWRKYFAFSRFFDKIDIQYASPELISYMFDIDIATVMQWYNTPKIQKEPLATFVQNSGSDYNKKKSIFSKDSYSNKSRCKVSFLYNAKQYAFAFDFENGRAKYFEFYGKK